MIPLHELSETGKAIETESKVVVAQQWGKGERAAITQWVPGFRRYEML